MRPHIELHFLNSKNLDFTFGKQTLIFRVSYHFPPAPEMVSTNFVSFLTCTWNFKLFWPAPAKPGGCSIFLIWDFLLSADFYRDVLCMPTSFIVPALQIQ